MHASSSVEAHAFAGRPRVGRTRSAFAALILGMLMAQLDTNIVVAALPSIGADLGSSAAVAGVTAVYLLTVTISTPALGKLGDLLGRWTVFVLSVLLFAVGSLACAAAPSMTVLIGARALQGLGGGGLVVTAVSALGEMFDRDELVKRQIYLTGTFAVAALAGPPLGGFLAAGPGWRWLFLINLPIGAIALLLGVGSLPHHRQPGALAGFDVQGAVLIAAAGAGIVALGSSHALATSPLWAPIVVLAIVVCGLLFLRVERRSQAPLIPLSLFSRPALSRPITVTGMTGVALFGTFTFIPLALAVGTGAGGGRIGTLLLALTIGQLVVTGTFSLAARRYPRMTAWGHLGLGLGVTGMALLAALPLLPPHGRLLATSVAIVGMALAGAALGLSMQAYTLLGQTSSPRDSFGAAMGTLTFARQLGGSLGAAAFGWILLTIPDRRQALAVILGLAALVLLTAAVLAPRRHHEHQEPPPAGHDL